MELTLKNARNAIKALSDDTRLRILNLVKDKEVSVTEICAVLKKKQPLISKHLTRLRLLGLVHDRRQGFNVYYYVSKNDSGEKIKLVKAIISRLSSIETFKKDTRELKNIRQSVKHK